MRDPHACGQRAQSTTWEYAREFSARRVSWIWWQWLGVVAGFQLRHIHESERASSHRDALVDFTVDPGCTRLHSARGVAPNLSRDVVRIACEACVLVITVWSSSGVHCGVVLNTPQCCIITASPLSVVGATHVAAPWYSALTIPWSRGGSLFKDPRHAPPDTL